MNTRIIELIQTPSLITKEDLHTINQELEKRPYLQALRALKLIGAHHHQPEDYPNILSETAAYTTDKKILYHLIFGKPKTEKIYNTETEEVPSGIIVTEEEISVTNFDEAISYPTNETPQHRENTNATGENTSVTEEDANVTGENTNATGESAIVTEKNTIAIEENTNVTGEKPIATRENISEEGEYSVLKELPQKEPTKLSYQQMESFLSFDLATTAVSPSHTADDIPQEIETDEVWQPMQIDTPLPDALLSSPKITTEQPTTTVVPDEEDRQEIEVSFFSTHIEPTPEIKQEKSATPPTIEETPVALESNIPNFIDTWRNWLKLDHSPPISVEEKKNQIIDKFIEANPSISKNEKHTTDKEYKEFVIKDKGDDISHLMTETLANLYVEQHLFAKGIEAYKILQEKHPEKKAYYKTKIKEIKALRTGQNKPN